MRNIRIIVEYDGTGLAGWQRQKDVPTIQSLLEEALARLTGSQVALIGAGRTDAGVHARGQAANFKTESGRSLTEIQRGANALLPAQIVIREVMEVPLDFHARYDALGKIYDYFLDQGPVRSALNRHFAWRRGPGLDLEAMARAMKSLIGRHDFASFQSTGTKVRTSVRRMKSAGLETLDDDLCRLTFEADGFLRHMVRALVGTLDLVGRGRLSPEEFEQILRARDRSQAGPTAPAAGLFLRQVIYRSDS